MDETPTIWLVYQNNKHLTFSNIIFTEGDLNGSNSLVGFQSYTILRLTQYIKESILRLRGSPSTIDGWIYNNRL